MKDSWKRNWRVICTVMYNTPFLAEISAVETNMKTNLCDPFLLVKFSIFSVSIKTVFLSNIKKQCFAFFSFFCLVIFCLPTVFLVAKNHNLYFIAKHN